MQMQVQQVDEGSDGQRRSSSTVDTSDRKRSGRYLGLEC